MSDAVAAKKRQKPLKILIILAVSVVLTVLSVTAFLLSYGKTKNMITLERRIYIRIDRAGGCKGGGDNQQAPMTRQSRPW